MSNLYSDDAWSAMQSNVSPMDHLPDLTFSNDDDFGVNGDYEHFGSIILSENRELEKGQALKDKIVNSRVDKANKLGLRGQEFSNCVELGITGANTKGSNVTDSLTQPIDDKTLQKESEDVQGDTLIDVMKDSSLKSQDMMSKHIEALDHLTALFQNQNKILNEANQIAVEKNKLLEIQLIGEQSKNQALVEGFMSVSQSLEYLPTLIETIAIASDRQVDIGNTANAHALQKNVNDAYAFNYDKDDEKGTKQALGAIASHLSVNAVATRNIEEHQKKQGDYMADKHEELTELNSSDFKDFLVDTYEGLSDWVEGELSEFDIFSYLLNETTKEEVYNGN